MWVDDPVNHPTMEYLSDLEDRLRAHCASGKVDHTTSSECTSCYNRLLPDITLWREAAETLKKPSSDSYHFVGDELYTGFVVHGEPRYCYPPWIKTTREELEAALTEYKPVPYAPKVMGIFPKTLNKWINGHCGSCFQRLILLPPSTKEKPIRARIVEQSPRLKGMIPDNNWCVFLKGKDTVVASKGSAPIFANFDRNGRHQLIAFDITFVGPVFDPKNVGRREFEREGWSTNWVAPRFYNCTFTDPLVVNQDTTLVDCRGKKVAIGMGHSCRFSNCQFDEVYVLCGRVCAKGSQFGTIELVKDKAECLYYLEDCTVGEMKHSVSEDKVMGMRGRTEVRFQWPDPEEELKSIFEEIQKNALERAQFNPDE